jgi:hypothetical protein
MRYRRLVEFAMGVQAFILLGPSAALYTVGALVWFPFFVFYGVVGVFQTAMTQGLDEVFHRAADIPAFYWGMNAFMIGAGIGFLSISSLYRIGYEGKSLREIRWWVWCGVVIGLVTAALAIQPQSLWRTRPPLGSALSDQLFIRYIFGLGPMMSSACAIIWLYWIGRSRGGCNEATQEILRNA